MILRKALLLIVTILFVTLSAKAQYVDRILRPCFSGVVPYVQVVTTATGNIAMTTCTGGSVTINGVPIGGGGGTSPGGSNTNVQFNNSGAFGGSNDLAWVAPQLTIGGAQVGKLRLSNTVPTNVILQVPAASFTSWVMTLPNNAGSSGQFLQTNGSGVTTWATASGGSGSPGGATTNVQFNNAGAFGGNTGLVYTGATTQELTDLVAANGGRSFIGGVTGSAPRVTMQPFMVGSEVLDIIGSNLFLDSGGTPTPFDGASIGMLLSLDTRSTQNAININVVGGIGPTNPFSFDNGRERLKATGNGSFCFASSITDASSAPNLCISRHPASSPTSLEVNTGTIGTLRDIVTEHSLAGGVVVSIASGFGTGPSIAGFDDAFRVTTGTVPGTGGVVNFGVAYSTAPVCQANDETTLTVILTTTPTASQVTITSVSGVVLAGDKIGVLCRGF